MTRPVQIWTMAVVLLIVALLPAQLLADRQDRGRSTETELLRVNPIPDADWIPLQSGVTLTFSDVVRPASVRVTLAGSRGGRYPVTLRGTEDQHTLVARPNRPFEIGETVTVTVEMGRRVVRSWQFHTVPRSIPAEVLDRIDQDLLHEFTMSEPVQSSSELAPRPSRTLDETDIAVVPPATMPDYEVSNHGGVTDGTVFVQAFNFPTTGDERFNFVISNDGELLYYHSFVDRVPFDFQPHDNVSRISYFTYPDRHIYLMDTTWTVVDTLSAGNGYRLDPHECLLFGDGSYWVISNDIRIIDMSEVVEGGDEEATVIGMVVQELDVEDNVLFEWRSLDHIPVTDADLVYIDLTEDVIDYCHTNSIEVDSDTSIVISSRNISEATRISRVSGEIIWRLSGTGNQFEFIDDPIPGFAIQHDARILENGHLTIFNNGGHEHNQISSVKEYELDPDAMTARLVWSYQNDELESIGWKMGSARRMPNGNTLIGWGTARNNRPYNAIASEVDVDGNILWDLHYAEEGSGDLISYRAYRSQIRGRAAKPYLYANWAGDHADIYLNYFGHDETTAFRLTYGELGSGVNDTISTSEGYLRLEGLNPDLTYELSMVAIDGEGVDSDVSNTVEIEWSPSSIGEEYPDELPSTITIEEIWPNPFNASTTVQVRLGHTSDLTISLVNLLGREVMVLKQGEMTAGVHRLSIGGDHLASGVYFLRVASQGDVVATRKLVLLR